MNRENILIVIILLAIIILVLLYGCGSEHKKESFSYGLNNYHSNPEMPPLNYATGQEPDYFYYIPLVNETDNEGHHVHIRKDGWVQDMEKLWGTDNYIKYYPEDTGVILEAS